MSHVRELASGEIFARRYRIDRLLRAGGMGAVYVVQDQSTRRTRALKVMHPAVLEAKNGRERFEREVFVGAQLKTEHVVEVLDAGVDEASGMPFFTMELLEGEELGDRLERERTLPRDLALSVLGQIARALDSAHALGIVHRDLKPQNVFLVPRADGSTLVKVLDFGIAKVVEGVQSDTTQSQGTPLYMAPEQTDRKSKVSTASDVWAFGLLAFRLLAGDNYWTAQSIEQLYRQLLIDPLQSPIERASQLGASLPPAFEGWFFACVARDPLRRFRSIAAAMRALETVLRGGTLPEIEMTLPASELDVRPEVDAIPSHKFPRWPIALGVGVVVAFSGAVVSERVFRPKAAPSASASVDAPNPMWREAADKISSARAWMARGAGKGVATKERSEALRKAAAEYELAVSLLDNYLRTRPKNLYEARYFFAEATAREVQLHDELGDRVDPLKVEAAAKAAALVRDDTSSELYTRFAGKFAYDVYDRLAAQNAAAYFKAGCPLERTATAASEAPGEPPRVTATTPADSALGTMPEEIVSPYAEPREACLTPEERRSDRRFWTRPIPELTRRRIDGRQRWLALVTTEKDVEGMRPTVAYELGDLYFRYGQFAEAKGPLLEAFSSGCGRMGIAFDAWVRLLAIKKMENDDAGAAALIAAAKKTSCAMDAADRELEKLLLAAPGKARAALYPAGSVEEVIATAKPELMKCYGAALDKDPTASASIKVDLAVDAAGKVTSTKLVEGKGPMELGVCVERTFTKLRFATGAERSLTVPVVLAKKP
ncbi:MAG: protein kinase domain-containing protein [Polyangiales bacterium]